MELLGTQFLPGSLLSILAVVVSVVVVLWDYNTSAVPFVNRLAHDNRPLLAVTVMSFLVIVAQLDNTSLVLLILEPDLFCFSKEGKFCRDLTGESSRFTPFSESLFDAHFL